VVPADIHDLFAASAGVAGALIGLLFVAISVAGDRLATAEASAQVHKIRAYAALTSFTNALTVSLFALIPTYNIGWSSAIVALLGLLFVVASLLSLVRLRQVRWATVRDGLFLVGLVVTFVYQLIAGTDLIMRPGDSDSVETIGTLVIVCFLIGIWRAWELIGGPSIGIRSEIAALVRGDGPETDGPVTDRPASDRPASDGTEAPDVPPA
jgi:hypothetical protein